MLEGIGPTMDVPCISLQHYVIKKKKERKKNNLKVTYSSDSFDLQIIYNSNEVLTVYQALSSSQWNLESSQRHYFHLSYCKYKLHLSICHFKLKVKTGKKNQHTNLSSFSARQMLLVELLWNCLLKQGCIRKTPNIVTWSTYYRRRRTTTTTYMTFKICAAK